MRRRPSEARLRLDPESGRVTFVFEDRPAVAPKNAAATGAQCPGARSTGRTRTQTPTRRASALR